MFREWNNRYEGSCYEKQPNIICLKTSAQGRTEETDKQILSLHKHEGYPRVNV